MTSINQAQVREAIAILEAMPASVLVEPRVGFRYRDQVCPVQRIADCLIPRDKRTGGLTVNAVAALLGVTPDAVWELADIYDSSKLRWLGKARVIAALQALLPAASPEGEETRP